MIMFGNDSGLDTNAPFILDIHDNIDNELYIIVSLSTLGEKDSNLSDVVENKVLLDMLKESSPIEIDNNNIFEIIFEKYIIYQTLNESYCLHDEYEIGQGKYFVEIQRSHLLDQLEIFAPVCTADEDGEYYPYKPRHFRIISQNHILEVISDKQPIIRKVAK